MFFSVNDGWKRTSEATPLPADVFSVGKQHVIQRTCHPVMFSLFFCPSLKFATEFELSRCEFGLTYTEIEKDRKGFKDYE